MPTIGVAIAVPDPWGSELQEYRTGLGDPEAGRIPTHVTLAPPTEMTAADVCVVHDNLEAAAAAAEPFTLHLRGTGTFRPVSPVVFVVVVEGISQCEQLALALRRGPLGAEPAFPYHPHVTVAHHLTEPCLDRAFSDLAGFECQFVVDRVGLYVHDDDTGWRPRREYPLRRGGVA